MNTRKYQKRIERKFAKQATREKVYQDIRIKALAEREAYQDTIRTLKAECRTLHTVKSKLRAAEFAIALSLGAL